MKDFDVNKVLQLGRKTNSEFLKKLIYWFCKHYFYCDIHPNNNIGNSVVFAHNALGVVINGDATIGERVMIQHHVTIGKNNKGGVPHISDGVYIGCYAVIIGDVTVGKNAVIGAGCVVTKDVADNAVVVGNPAHQI